jgi:hypothetical protein
MATYKLGRCRLEDPSFVVDWLSGKVETKRNDIQIPAEKGTSEADCVSLPYPVSPILLNEQQL